MKHALIAAGLAAVLSVQVASAQRSDQRRERVLEAAASEKDAREMVELVMMVRLSRELELTEEETVLLVRRMSEFRGELTELYRERRGFAEALRVATQEDVDEEAVRSALKILKELDRRLNNIKLDAHDKLSEGLTARQQARLYIFLQDFEENMRRMVQRVRERSRYLEGGRTGRVGPPPRRAPQGDSPGSIPRRGNRDRDVPTDRTDIKRRTDRDAPANPD